MHIYGECFTAKMHAWLTRMNDNGKLLTWSLDRGMHDIQAND
jgi:hypothetical protein